MATVARVLRASLGSTRINPYPLPCVACLDLEMSLMARGVLRSSQ